MNINIATIVADYAAMDRSGRATVRSTIDAELSAAISGGNFELATTLNNVKLAITNPVAPVVDHTATYIERITSLRIAADVMTMVATSNNITVGDCDYDSAIVDRIAQSFIDDSDVVLSDDESRIAKLVRIPRSGTTNRTYNGPRRSVAAHIESAFEDMESGDTMKIRDIARHTSDTYGDDHPSDGAVGAALFAKDGTPKTIGNITGAIVDGRRVGMVI